VYRRTEIFSGSFINPPVIKRINFGILMESKLFTGSLLASALYVSLCGALVMAQGTTTPGIDRAQQDISARIQQGMASGHITPSEARAPLPNVRLASRGTVS
jgi:hypothetical protein